MPHDIFRCPVTGDPLHPASAADLAFINQISHAEVKEALVSNEFAYPIVDGIYLLTVNYAISLNSSRRFEIDDPSETIKLAVTEFYNETGWSRQGQEHSVDARLNEDLRTVSDDYRHEANMRIMRELPAKGRYLLDVASGPIQYDDYLEFSKNYAIRVCADLSISALRQAQSRIGAGGIYVLADITNLPILDQRIDAFVSLNTVYHVPQTQQRQAFLELYRVLAVNGAGLVVDSWKNPPLTLCLEAPFNAARLIRSVARTLRGHETKNTGLYFKPHKYRWFSHQEWPFDYVISTWRTLSVPILRRYVPDFWLGSSVLKMVTIFENRYPKLCGRWGQYPLIVISGSRSPIPS